MDHRPLRGTLDDGETIESEACAGGDLIMMTNRRLVIEGDGRRLLDIPVEALRRIQFDIEKRRPAALVFVPENARDQPQVLSVTPDQYHEVAATLAAIGRRLGPLN